MHGAAIGVLQHRQRQQAWQNDDQRNSHLEGSANDRSHLSRSQIMGAQHSLDNEEVGSPVSKADDEAQSEDDSCPMHAHRIVAKLAHRAPKMGVVTSANI